MSDIAPATAIALVHDGLRDDVLAAVADDPHASSALKAAIGILRNVAAELEAGERWCEPLIAPGLAAVAGWPDALRGASTDAAAEVERHLAAARAAAGPACAPATAAPVPATDPVPADPAAARTALMRAAECVLAAVWRHPDLLQGPLLTEARRVVRSDLDARTALAP